MEQRDLAAAAAAAARQNVSTESNTTTTTTTSANIRVQSDYRRVANKSSKYSL